MKQQIGAAYIHIPFCQQKCSYCDFVSFAGSDDKVVAEYINALLKEIDLAAKWSVSAQGSGLSPLTSVFIGGGTPTVISPGHIGKIMEKLKRTFGLAEDGEFSIEANPGTVSEKSLAIYRAAGFNRISFGLQAVQPRLLQLLGRAHNAGDFVAGVETSAKLGFQFINADIMFGLPGQSLNDVAQTLDLLLALPVKHISFYSLSLEEGTPLYEKSRTRPELLPDDDMDRSHYRYIRQRLKKNGFLHYEISNAAVEGHQCRHNLVYWRTLPYYGFGLAAHSYLQDRRLANPESLRQYVRLISGSSGDSFPPAAALLETLDEKGRMQEYMILGLRLLAGVRFSSFSRRFNADLRQVFAGALQSLAAGGLLVIGRDVVKLSEKGLNLANQVFAEFLD